MNNKLEELNIYLNDDRQANAIGKANERWNEIHRSYERDKIKYDNWLELFEKSIDNCETAIIDLGCGSGNDTLYLVERGKEVIPCDYSSNAIQNIKKNFPEVERTECFDMTKGLPFEDNFTNLIICDLSLHYFKEKTTLEILEEIKRVLKPSGLLIFRVNSVKDVNYGVGEGKEIEKHLYETEDGRYKRFFDQEDIDKFFANWEKIFVHEETMGRYEKEKVLWKCAMKVKK